MKKDNFYKDSLILTISNLTTGMFGFMFSILLSRELGAEGMGLYGLIMPIYNLFICLICGGMVTAVSKVAAIYYSKHDMINLNRTIKAALTFDLIWSLLVMIMVYASSSFISLYVIKDSRTLFSILAVSPALIFVALSSILKGYFYGISKVKIPALIDILEKAVRIGVLLTIVNLFLFKDIKHTVMSAYIALTIGEFTSFMLLYTVYRVNRNNFNYSPKKAESRAQLLFDVLVISFPLCLNGFLSTALGTASTLIVPRRLVSIGLDYSTALSMIGKFTGMAFNITFFPLIVINSMSIVLVPNLSESLSKKDFTSLESRVYEVIRIAFQIGVCTLFVCLAIPDSLGKLFFNRTDLGNYIKFAALSIPFTYVAATTFGILNGLSRQSIILRNSLIVSVEELLLLYILTGIPSINIYSYSISQIITSVTLLILNLKEIKKKLYIEFSAFNFIISILNGVFIYFILKTINNIVSDSIFIFKNVLLIALGFAVFFIIQTIVIKKNPQN